MRAHSNQNGVGARGQGSRERPEPQTTGTTRGRARGGRAPTAIALGSFGAAAARFLAVPRRAAAAAGGHGAGGARSREVVREAWEGAGARRPHRSLHPRIRTTITKNQKKKDETMKR